MTIRRRSSTASAVAVPVGDGDRPLGGAVTAAAGFAYESNRSDGLPDFTLTPAQVEIDRAVDTIGWAGFYVQIKAMLGAMCPWYVERREGTDWVPVDDPRINALAHLIRPSSRSTAGMRFRSLMLQASIAEHAFWPASTPDRGLVFEIAHPEQMRKSPTSTELFAVASRQDARPGGVGWREFETARLRRLWIPHRRWPDEADPELAAVRTELRLYETNALALLRTSQSRLIMNGLLYIPTVPPAGADTGSMWTQQTESATSDVPSTPAGGSLHKLIADMAAFGARAYRDHDGNDVAAVMPYPFPHFDKPEMIELGRSITAEQLEGLAEIVYAAARGLHIPTQFLVTGEAAQNHWNDAELRRALHERAVYPELEPHNEFWSEMALRPIMRLTRAGGVCIGDDDPDEYRLAADTSTLDVKSDSFQTWALAYQTGAASRAWLADKLGVPESQMLQLPANVDEWQHWLYTRSPASRSTAETTTDFPELQHTGIGPATDAGDDTLPGAPGDIETMPPAEPVAASAVALIEAGRR